MLRRDQLEDLRDASIIGSLGGNALAHIAAMLGGLVQGIIVFGGIIIIVIASIFTAPPQAIIGGAVVILAFIVALSIPGRNDRRREMEAEAIAARQYEALLAEQAATQAQEEAETPRVDLPPGADEPSRPPATPQFCPRCGFENPATSHYCADCGRTLG